MNLGTYEPTASEVALIKQFNFDIKISGDRFVVRHPKWRKLGKIEGGNLADVIARMADAEARLLAHPRYQQKAALNTEPKPEQSDSNAIEPASDELVGVRLDDSGGKPAKPAKAKSPGRDPAKLAFLQAFKLWLTYPNEKPEFIKARLTALGIPAKDSSVTMLRHMCNTMLRAQIELGFVTEEGLSTRRKELVSE